MRIAHTVRKSGSASARFQVRTHRMLNLDVDLGKRLVGGQTPECKVSDRSRSWNAMKKLLPTAELRSIRVVHQNGALNILQFYQLGSICQASKSFITRYHKYRPFCNCVFLLLCFVPYGEVTLRGSSNCTSTHSWAYCTSTPPLS